jgi:hypothetical protein
MGEPVAPFERVEVHRPEAEPWPESPDHLGLEETDDRFRGGAASVVADAASGKLDAGFRKALGVANGRMSRAPVGAVDRRLPGPMLMEDLHRRIQRKTDGAVRPTIFRVKASTTQSTCSSAWSRHGAEVRAGHPARSRHG